MARTNKIFALTLAATMTAFAIGCGPQAPQLPPEESMELPTFFDDKAQASASAETTNVGVAALSVGAVTLVLNLQLLIPRAMFLSTLRADPYQDGNDWVWARNHALLGVASELRGRVENEELIVSMEVDGLRDGIELKDFVWYTGNHRAGNGEWLFYTPSSSGPVVSANWNRVSATEKNVAYENIDQASGGYGDTLTYDLDGTTATMDIFDADDGSGVSASFTVQWDTDAGNGFMDVNGDRYCWDTLANGQVDIPCS